jgi:hypothetical protein
VTEGASSLRQLLSTSDNFVGRARQLAGFCHAWYEWALSMGAVVRSVLLFLPGFSFCISSGPALAEKRVALIIGMSRYRQVPQLTNSEFVHRRKQLSETAA